MLSIDKLPKKRYKREGQCNRCGWCCLQEDPPCPYLKQEEDGKYTCLVFEDPEKRYLRCSLHPCGPPILHEECGYYFLDTWENNKVIKREVK